MNPFLNKTKYRECTTFDTPIVLPDLSYFTNDRLFHFDISAAEIKDLVKLIRVGKVHGHDDISVKMIKLCGDEICLPSFWYLGTSLPLVSTPPNGS